MILVTVEVAAPYGPAVVSFDSEKGVVVAADELTESFLVTALGTARDTFGRGSERLAINPLDLYFKLQKLFGEDVLTVVGGKALIEKQVKAFVQNDKNGILT